MSYFNQVAIKDVQTDKQVWVDEFNAIRANPTFRLIGKTFIGSTKDTNFWTETVAGSGSVAQANGSAVLATGATANSTVQYQTVHVAHWVPGQENTFRAVARVGDLGASNNIRNWGAFNTTDGFFFQLNATALNIVSRKAGSDIVVPQASWNGNAHGLTNLFTLDTNFHIWEIKMSYADIHFYIDHKIMHTLIPSSALYTATLDLPVTMQNNNSSGGAANVLLETGVAFVSRVGELWTQPVYKNINGAGTFNLKIGSGQLHHVIFNSVAGTSSTLYDNTVGSGTVIAAITTGAIGHIDFQCLFNTGLTVVNSGACNLTVVYE